MSSSYELWLTDDSGRRIAPIDKYSFFTYSRTVQGFGALQLGMEYPYLKSIVPDVFKPDWRIDIWRKPEENFPSRREGSFLLRKFVIYEQVEGLKTIEYFGRSPIDILRRGALCYEDPAQYVLSDLADDVMIQLVSDALTYGKLEVASGEFTVGASAGLGPSVDISVQGENLLDALTDVKNQTIAKNLQLSTYKKVYFDVEEYNTLTNGGFGYIFKTYVTLRGQDRTSSGLIFSTDNGNLRKPTYYEDYLDEINTSGAIYSGSGSDCDLVQTNDAYLSRWNKCKKVRFISNTDNLYNELYAEIAKNQKKEVFTGDFLNTPGGPTQPRSLYGVDWDMGDLLRVEFAERTFDAEVKVVHVSVNESGKENIVGQTEVGAQ